MLEITGWLVLSPSTDGEHSKSQIDSLLFEIFNLIKPMQSFNQFLEIKELNGVQYLFIGINHNHDNGYYDLILELVKHIGRISKGSYGITYVRDHESIGNNFFKIIRLAKGNVDVFNDSIISPCSPIIED